MNKKLIIIFTALVILSYTIASLTVYEVIGFKVVTVDDYSLDNKWCIDVIETYDNNGNYDGTEYFCIENKGYTKDDKVLVVFLKEDEHNTSELIHIKTW